ncbi:hypothetical protein ACWEOE_10820 [Amycolatopsis sp. NPDC004368]
MDICYVLKAEERNEELRHSLRSVARNLPGARVWIAGYKPSWVTNVDHIDVKQLPSQKHPNSIRNQRAALACTELSDPFAFFNDDFFVMKPLDDVPVTNWGYVDDVLKREGRTRLGSSYHRSMVATRDYLHTQGFDKPISYALHTPLVTHKQPYLEAMDAYNRTDCWIQHSTIYGNVYGLGGERYDRDVKVYSTYETVQPWMKDSTFLSTSDNSFLRGHIGKWLRAQFPEPCRFEKA